MGLLYRPHILIVPSAVTRRRKHMKPAVLILAAGVASRMGAAKALLSLPSLPEGGRCSALRGLVSLYRSLGVENVVIVSGFHAEVVEAELLALGLSAVRNPTRNGACFHLCRRAWRPW